MVHSAPITPDLTHRTSADFSKRVLMVWSSTSSSKRPALSATSRQRETTSESH